METAVPERSPALALGNGDSARARLVNAVEAIVLAEEESGVPGSPETVAEGADKGTPRVRPGPLAEGLSRPQRDPGGGGCSAAELPREPRKRNLTAELPLIGLPRSWSGKVPGSCAWYRRPGLTYVMLLT